MGVSKIIITGIPEKGPKFNSDRTVDLIFNINMTEAVPKGLKCLGESIYSVRVAFKTWKKIVGNATKNSFYIIKGEPKAAVNKDGTPFISVICFEISIREETNSKELPNAKVENLIENNSANINKAKELKIEEKSIVTTFSEPETIVKERMKPIDNSVIKEESKNIKVSLDVKKDPETEQPKTDQTNKTVKPIKHIAWYSGIEDQLITLNLDEVCITEKAHLSAYTVNVIGLDKAYDKGYVSAPIAVKKLEDGNYTLVAGYKPYIQAKLLNYKTINAYITDLTHDEFVVKYKIEERKR
jgi:hypothetical protein